MKRACILLIVLALALDAPRGLAAPSEHYGQVTFGAVPVPGATVTASQGDKQVATSTDQQGVYKFADLVDGKWTLKIEMIGFAPISQEVSVAPDSPPPMWELKLRPFEDIARDAVRPEPASADTVRPATSAEASAANKPDNSGNGEETKRRRQPRRDAVRRKALLLSLPPTRVADFSAPA